MSTYSKKYLQEGREEEEEEEKEKEGKRDEKAIKRNE